jgi:hypothetical protein
MRMLCAAILLFVIFSIAVGFGHQGAFDLALLTEASWKETPELRVIMTSTSDWARIMFDDFNNTHANGIGISRILGCGWFFGNDTDDRIDRGKSLTYVDVIYNTTVARTGDFVGFYKGDNDFSYTRMYVDVTLDINVSAPRRYFYLVVAGAGVTTFQVADKVSGVTLWQETVQGNSFTQYLSRSVSAAAFFPKQTLDSSVVFLLVGLVAVVLVVANPLVLRHRKEEHKEWNGL